MQHTVRNKEMSKALNISCRYILSLVYELSVIHYVDVDIIYTLYNRFIFTEE